METDNSHGMFSEHIRRAEEQAKKLVKMADKIRGQIPDLMDPDTVELRKELPALGSGVYAELSRKGKVIISFSGDVKMARSLYERLENLKPPVDVH